MLSSSSGWKVGTRCHNSDHNVNNHRCEDLKTYINTERSFQPSLTPEEVRPEFKHLPCCKTPDGQLADGQVFNRSLNAQWQCEEINRLGK